MRRVLVSIRLKAEINQKIRQQAEKEGISLSEAINQACERYLSYRELKPLTILVKKTKRKGMEEEHANR